MPSIVDAFPASVGGGFFLYFILPVCRVFSFGYTAKEEGFTMRFKSGHTAKEQDFAVYFFNVHGKPVKICCVFYICTRQRFYHRQLTVVVKYLYYAELQGKTHGKDFAVHFGKSARQRVFAD